MNELQRDKIQVNEIRVKDAVPNIIVDILEYTSPKADYGDNELVTAAWVLQQTGVTPATNEIHTPLSGFGLDTYTAPTGYSVNKAIVMIGADNGGFNIRANERIQATSELARQVRVDDQGEVGYIVWMP